MRSIGYWSGMFAAVLLLGACGSDDGEPLSHSLEELDVEISAIATAASAHDQTIGSAANLGDMSVEESAYAANIGAIHEEIHHLLGDMSMCTFDGATLDVTAVEATVEELEEEIAAHATAMAAAADTDAALTEETRHQSAIAELVTTLDGEHQSMSASGDDYMCHHHAE